VKHITYPDNFMAEMETTISQIVAWRTTPREGGRGLRGRPGDRGGLPRIKEKRPDILCFAGEPQEDPNVIAGAADLSINSDTLSMGYIMIAAAKRMGADTYVHISFPRHMSYELLSRRRQIMEAACRDLGLKFVFETAPDPTSDVGVAGAQQYVLEKVPACSEVREEGRLLQHQQRPGGAPAEADRRPGGFYVQTDSPLQGYAGALGIDLGREKGDWPAILKKIEQVIVRRGGRGRLATWSYPSGYCITAALGEFGRQVVEGKAKLGNFRQMMQAFQVVSPGITWNGSYYTDVASGLKKRNFILVYQDTYVFGQGLLGMTKVKVPEKYYRIR
jgi:hypothetical protein